MLADIAALGINSVERVERHKLYFLCGDLSEQQVTQLCDELLVDPIVEVAVWGLAQEPVETSTGAARIEVGLLQGVTDSVARNIQSRAAGLGMSGLRAVASAKSYLIYGAVSQDELHTLARRLLYNDVIEYYAIGQLTTHVGETPPESIAIAEMVSVRELDNTALLELSRDRLLSLDLTEMKAIQAYYCHEGREPTDVELESLAQTWSEHCVHKTFKGIVDYTEIDGAHETHHMIDSLIKTYLQAATSEIDAPWVRSAFVDNAGIVDFDDDFEISFKAETHNHPSALEPFGGANTGVGGVIRDIIGVSARPIANTDVLCFGPLDANLDELPASVLHPRRIYEGVVSGVEDYGNKMGIPTVNGAIYFDPGYTANPLVYCGCVGIAPVNTHRRQANPGDIVVVLGGRTGRDGLHGATFSSIELTDETGETSGGAVQIGNPITEKQTLDAILVARDEGLYTSITDCGAGGLSSAVSEMGEDTGVTVQLERVPLKYVGLGPWEIWISEAQERMVLAVPPENLARLRNICDGFSVEMTEIGTFRGDGRLDLRYGDQVVADLSMAFLHGGVPRKHLTGVWQRPSFEEPATQTDAQELTQSLLWILSHPNVRSKEDVVRRYDHEVQGGTIVKPFTGLCNDGPSDAAVLKPLEVVDSWKGLALGCGFNPAYGEIDPYAMAISAIDEAVRNVVAVGGDPKRIAILDNFCWGNPLLADRMGELVRALKGCYDGAKQYGTPFISGKDSLNNEYTDGVTGQQVAIPPSLLVSAMAIVADVRQTCTMDLKRPGDALYVLGETRDELGGSYYYRRQGFMGNNVPSQAEHGPIIARRLHQAIMNGLIAACHDCSEGGLAVALSEMALAGRLGAQVEIDKVPTNEPLSPESLLFSESNGRYIVQVSEENASAFESLFKGLPCACIGQATDTHQVAMLTSEQGLPIIDLPVEALTQAWRGHLEGATS